MPEAYQYVEKRMFWRERSLEEIEGLITGQDDLDDDYGKELAGSSKKSVGELFKEEDKLKLAQCLGAAGALAALACLIEPASAQGPFLRANTVHELVQELRVCWEPPKQNARMGMQITVRLSFTRSGAVLGRPKITYETEEATDEQRLAYRIALAEMLLRCTPVAMTEALGAAIAGRPITIKLDDLRRPKPPRRRLDI